MTPDPVIVSTIAAAVCALGSEYVSGVASEAGKTTWNRLSELFGWTTTSPPTVEIRRRVHEVLSTNPEATAQVVKLLQHDGRQLSVHQTVGTVEVHDGKVVIVSNLTGGITL